MRSLAPCARSSTPSERVRDAGSMVGDFSEHTAVLCTIAVFVFGMLSAFHDDSIRRFRCIASGALLGSFLRMQRHSFVPLDEIGRASCRERV